MDERDQQRQAIDAETEGTGRLRAGVDAAKHGLERARDGVEDAAWAARERVLWPAEDKVGGLDRRAKIGIFGGGAVALGAVIAAVIVATGGSSSSAPVTTEALVVKQVPPPVVKEAPAPKPKAKVKAPAKPAGPTLHGAAPDFSPAKDVKGGVGDGEAVEKGAKSSAAQSTGDAPAARGSSANGGDSAARGAAKGPPANGGGGDNQAATASEADESTGAGNAAASTAKIGATPKVSAAANEQAQTLEATGSGVGLAEKGAGGSGVVGPVAPKAAKQTARRFAQAFVVYEVGGVDGKVRSEFRHTSTKQLSRALLHRPPRQPAAVKVPRAKVVTVVAGPSKNGVYPVSVSLLRVGATSELRLELERGVGKKWQVTNVLG
ncbi:MAG TPA: hypothetical protein VGC32_04480 [Solirubrobacterales bacterium]